MVRRDWGSIPGQIIPKTQKLVLDASLLNSQHYKNPVYPARYVSRVGTAIQSKEKHLLLHVIGIEEGTFGSLSTTVANYTYLPTPPLGQDMTQGQFLSGV